MIGSSRMDIKMSSFCSWRLAPRAALLGAFQLASDGLLRVELSGLHENMVIRAFALLQSCSGSKCITW